MNALVAAEQVSLPALVRSAAQALAGATTAAEVLDARDKATLAYDAAKRAARIQKAKRAHDDIVAATHRAQADALEIEAAAKRRLADEYDAARPAGAEKGGRPKTVRDDNGFTAAEAGLTRTQIHDARQMRDAIAANPAVVRDALDDILARGDEPTRAALRRAIQPAAKSLGLNRENLRAAVGTDTATNAERGNNLYETPPEAMRALLSLARFSPTVWEPACGKGAISRMLEDAGYEVLLSDLIDYGTHNRHGELQEVGDFLRTRRAADGIRGPWRGALPGHPDIVTNPPYGTNLNAFVAHALREHRPRRMALLLNLNFLCGFDDPDRCFAMDECPPARIYVFTRRLPMMHRDGWDGPEASSRMNTAWFIWELREEGGEETYSGPTEILRIDWKVFENAKPCGPTDQAAFAPAAKAGKASPQADPPEATASPLPPAPSPNAPVEFSVGGMKKGSYARFSVRRSDRGFSVSVEFEFKGHSGGSFSVPDLFDDYAAALSAGLDVLAGRLSAVLQVQDSVTTDHHRAAAKAGLQWIEDRRAEWGLGSPALPSARPSVTEAELAEWKALGAIDCGVAVDGPLVERLGERGLVLFGDGKISASQLTAEGQERLRLLDRKVSDASDGDGVNVAKGEAAG